MIRVNDKSPLAFFVGDKPVLAIYRNDRRIWPDPYDYSILAQWDKDTPDKTGVLKCFPAFNVYQDFSPGTSDTTQVLINESIALNAKPILNGITNDLYFEGSFSTLSLGKLALEDGKYKYMFGHGYTNNLRRLEIPFFKSYDNSQNFFYMFYNAVAIREILCSEPFYQLLKKHKSTTFFTNHWPLISFEIVDPDVDPLKVIATHKGEQ